MAGKQPVLSLSVGQKIHGFVIEQIDDLAELQAWGVLASHPGSGARVYHVVRDDSENVFAFSFRTLPPSSNGIAHILEHTVLCGSQRYPVKDPFIQLARGSMNTFLNALTYPDKTVYPAASPVRQDLFNLMAVYGDAVFFPLLREEAFRQEGHRLEPGTDGHLQRAGIVFNEMKGNYATEDNAVGELAQQKLLPDTAYGVDSGGDPRVIPSLTYEEFVAFHRRNYHPSNCLIYLYGDIPSADYFQFLDQHFLSRFGPLPEAADQGSAAASLLQPRWDAPRTALGEYPAAAGEETDGRSSFTMLWLLPDSDEPLDRLKASLLSELLLGGDGSPLQKALIESHLGEDLSPASGLSGHLRELTFGAGLRGTDPERADAIRDLVIATLTEIAEGGFDSDLVEAGLRQFEFHHREIKGGPYGMRLLNRVMRGWLHGFPPANGLRFDPVIAELKRQLKQEPGLLSDLVRNWLLENTHRLDLTVRPKPGLADEWSADEAGEVTALESRMTAAERRALEEANRSLTRFQSEPDREEDLATIPFLSRADAPTEVEHVPYSLETVLGRPVLVHDLFTEGLVYLDGAIDLSGLSAEELVLLPMYTSMLSGSGLPDMDYDRLAVELDLRLGRFGVNPEVSERLDSGMQMHLGFRVAALEDRIGDAADLVSQLFAEANVDSTARLRDLLAEARNDLRSAMLPAGHQMAMLGARRGRSSVGVVEELWRGPNQLLALSAIDPETELEVLGHRLRLIQQKLLSRARLTLSVTAGGHALTPAMQAAEEFALRFPGGETGNRAGNPVAGRGALGSDTVAAAAAGTAIQRIQAFEITSQVNYVAVNLPGSRLGDPQQAHEMIASSLLSTSYLWEQVRMKGGAYGGFARSSGLPASFDFGSYRDPRLAETLAAYRAGLEWLDSAAITERDVELAVIGVVGRDARPLAPGEKSSASFHRYLSGITHEVRQARRNALIGAGVADVQRVGQRLRAAWDDRLVAVLGGTAALDSAAESVPELLSNRVRLPV